MIQHPIEKLEAVAKHRLQRLEQVYMALEQPMELYQLAQAVYPDLAASFQNAIEGSLLALLETLLEENRVEKIDERYKQRIS
jgi:exonuclease VII small subunit